MSTVTIRSIVDTIIANDGIYPGDPPVAKIVEYNNSYNGELAWGLVYDHQDPETYAASDFVLNPRVIFERATA